MRKLHYIMACVLMAVLTLLLPQTPLVVRAVVGLALNSFVPGFIFLRAIGYRHRDFVDLVAFSVVASFGVVIGTGYVVDVGSQLVPSSIRYGMAAYYILAGIIIGSTGEKHS
ncbi:MAG: hypothetical protein ABIH11_06870 [Candidatus Altiarchaeota archaeon]